MGKQFIFVAATSICAFAGAYAGVHLPSPASLDLLPKNSAEWAAWIQAIGAILAIVSGIVLMFFQNRHSERLLIRQFEQTARDAARAELGRVVVYLTVAAHSAAGIKAIIDQLSSVSHADLLWTLRNQANMVKYVMRPALGIPMHELSTPKLVQQVFSVTSLGGRLEDSVSDWLKHDSPDIADVKATMNILNEDWEKSYADLKATIEQLGQQAQIA